jgi:hypothetical protein
MGSALSMYKIVEPSLLAFQKEYDEILSYLDKEVAENSEKQREEDLLLQEAENNYKKHSASVEAFRKIAKEHINNTVDDGAVRPYDILALQKLQVMINTNLKDDPYAKELYTSACGQLRFLEEEINKRRAEREKNRLLIDDLLKDAQEKFNKETAKFKTRFEDYLKSEEMQKFSDIIRSDLQVFLPDSPGPDFLPAYRSDISIGCCNIKLPCPKGMETMFSSVLNIPESYVGIPYMIDMSSGSSLLVNYYNDTEDKVLSGLQNMLLNIARYIGNHCRRVVFIDPVRFHNSALGVAASLADDDYSYIDPVPVSADAITAKINYLMKDANADDSYKELGIYVFHNFPQGYDSSLVKHIQQLVVNAKHYNISVVITHNESSKYSSGDESLQYISSYVSVIQATETGFQTELSDVTVPFNWYYAPSQLPDDLEKRYVYLKEKPDTSNLYQERVGIDVPEQYRKGVRYVSEIPYGVDNSGNLLKLSFEESNFATFICGASRSGKSTLLHSLITGIIRDSHPDDIEIWLVDFKMTEFSRYCEHLPPHIRYIVLDESPELVYDIIDALTERLVKRQNTFKGRWQKLSDVPSEKYMPAIFVIIDEFSIMSQIIADSVNVTNDDYKLKIQNLLAKGAALGFHFIFCSQGFSDGTQGLNDYSKKQIQQRIAMKTKPAEIKDTLDLLSASDEDKNMMEQLQVHNALIRIPEDARGNHLLLSKVLYISDYKEQEKMIDEMSDKFQSVTTYQSDANDVYLDKKPLIIDGSSFSSFDSKRSLIEKNISENKELIELENVVLLYPGEPRRLMSVHPIEMYQSYGENLLMVAPAKENEPAVSVICSLIESMKYSKMPVDIWTTRRSMMYRKLQMLPDNNSYNYARDLDEVCEQIHKLRKKIESHEEGKKTIILFGLETLITDMKYQDNDNSNVSVKSKSLKDTKSINYDVLEIAAGLSNTNTRNGNRLTVDQMIAKAKSDSNNSNTIVDDPLKMIREGNRLSNFTDNKDDYVSDDSKDNEQKNEVYSAYDARDDLKYILTHGPRYGYHFIAVFHTCAELDQCKIDTGLFRHKLLFRISRADAVSLLGSSSATAVAQLGDHSFRYSNGLDALSYRPYLHSGLKWDGWELVDGMVKLSGNNEEEYP